MKMCYVCLVQVLVLTHESTKKYFYTACGVDLWGGTCGGLQACHFSPPRWSSINQKNHAKSPHLITNQNMMLVNA